MPATTASPDGIEPGNASYLREPRQPALHDRLTEGDGLAAVDIRIVLGELGRYLPGVVADFGCGTGRTFQPLADAGWQVLGIDLSRPMLEAASRRMSEGSGELPGDNAHTKRPWLVQASLTGLDCIADQSLDAGICLFSTLGMLRGKPARSKFLRHARRIIRPGGPFIVHAHNVWNQRRFPGGWTWLARSALSSLTGRTEFGDRWANTAGVQGLFIHSFRLGGLIEELRSAGWTHRAIWPHREMAHPHSTNGAPTPAVIPQNTSPRASMSDRWNAVGWTICGA